MCPESLRDLTDQARLGCRQFRTTRQLLVVPNSDQYAEGGAGTGAEGMENVGNHSVLMNVCFVE